jgi:hypothetical protein
MRLVVWRQNFPSWQYAGQGRDTAGDPPLVLPLEVVAAAGGTIPTLVGAAAGTHTSNTTSGTGAATIPTLIGAASGYHTAMARITSQWAEVFYTELGEARVASQWAEVFFTELGEARVAAQFVEAFGTVAEVITKFRDGDLGTGITVDGDGVCVTSSTGSTTTAVATNYVANDLVFFSFNIDTLPSGTITVGVGPQNISKSQEVGFNARSAGYRSTGNLYTGGSASALGTGSYAAGDQVNVAVKRSTGEVWFGKNGTFNGDPVAGTSPAATITATVFYPAVTLAASGQKVCLATTYGGFSGVPPSTYVPLDPYQGIGRATIPTLEGYGTDYVAPVTGTAAAVVPTLSGDAAGDRGAAGTASATIPTIIGDAEGVRGVAGTGSATLPTLVGGAEGARGVTGAGAGVIPAFTGAGDADLGVSGAAAGAVPTLIGQASGVRGVSGSGAGVIPSFDTAAAGSFVRPANDQPGARGRPGRSRRPWLSTLAEEQLAPNLEPVPEPALPPAPVAGIGAAVLPFPVGSARGGRGARATASASVPRLGGYAPGRFFDLVAADNEVLLLVS